MNTPADTSPRHAAILAQTRATRPPLGISPATYIERAAVAAAIAAANGQGSYSIEVARERWPDDAVTQHVITRGATSPATTTAATWAAPLAAASTGEFFSSLPESAGSKLIAAGLRVSLDGYNTLALPRRTGAPTAAPWVAQGQPIPSRNYVVGAATLGRRRRWP